MLKRNMTIMLLFTLILSLFASTGSAYGNAIDEQSNPLLDSKEVLNYLFWTKDDKLKADVASLQTALGLSDQQMTQLKDMGLKERNSARALQLQAQSLTVDSYNAKADTLFQVRNAALQSLLQDKHIAFEEWVTKGWADEKEYRNTWLKTKYGANADVPRISGIFATQYDPDISGSYEVALPDKYIKFANKGWISNIPVQLRGTYGNPKYVVNVYNPNTVMSALGVEVKDVGPWNVDDNYWDTANGSNPRRFGSGLALGTPASTAAYYNNWNNGKDSQGRKVLNPAGIDLSPGVAATLGLATNENAWVDVRYEYLP